MPKHYQIHGIVWEQDSSKDVYFNPECGEGLSEKTLLKLGAVLVEPENMKKIEHIYMTQYPSEHTDLSELQDKVNELVDAVNALQQRIIEQEKP